jgi:hypothetical protein
LAKFIAKLRAILQQTTLDSNSFICLGYLGQHGKGTICVASHKVAKAITTTAVGILA